MDTLVELLLESVKRFPNTPFLEADREGIGRISLSRAGLLERAAAVAARLAGGGVRPGDAVGLLSPNRPEWGAGYFGILLAGAVVVPLDVNLKEGELSNILSRSGAAALVTDQTEAARGAGLRDRGQNLKHLFRCDTAEAAPDARAGGWPGERRGPDDLALLSFSSGTTGTAKGIMLTHRNIASNAVAALSSFQCGPEDVFLSILPLHHMFEGTGGFLCPLLAGARVYYLDSRNPRVLVEAMQREGASILLMVPALARLIHKRICGQIEEMEGVRGMLGRLLFSLSRAALRHGWRIGHFLLPQVRSRLSPRLRYLVSGGAALDVNVAFDLLALGLEIIQGYGLTETAPVTHTNRPGKANRLGTVGPPVPGVEARIVPVEGAAEGEGEIWIRGPNVMRGYYDAPGLTAEVFEGEWFRTGDIGRVDAEDYLTICGRVKNVIVAPSGKNIYPEEVEEELAGSPLFQDACVIGKKDARGGEEVFAVVTINPEAGVPEGVEREEIVRRELNRLCAALADYKRVSGFCVWPDETLPQTTTLKYRREEIKKVLRELPGYSPDDF
ncbi:MAG: class I adenylate-forming enzyme family protein [bacterium]|nr:class I adenylate-forming enzyme family protein [bacterium]